MLYDLSIIIPVYNESKTIEEILERVSTHPDLVSIRKQFLVVDDGSSDGTVETIKNSKFFRDPNFQFFFHEKNKGKASAIRTAIVHLKGKYTIIQDADLEYSVEDIPKLLKTAEQNNFSAVYGSRNLNRESKRGGFLFFWGGKFLTLLTNILYGQKLTDMPTCYKLIKTEILQSLPLQSKRFEFCPEVTALLSKKGIAIKEEPIQYTPRSKSEGKKINWKDGVEAIFTLLKLRFIPGPKTHFAGMLFLFVCTLYLSTWNGHFVGYEKETADAAIGLLHGDYLIRRAGIGAAILYFPFLFFQKILSLPLTPFLTLVPIVYSALTIVFLFLSLEKLTQKIHVSLLVSFLIAVGTSVWPYSVMGMEYQVMLYMSILLYFLLRWEENRKFLFAPALVFGIICVTKSYGVLIGIPYVLFLVVSLYRNREFQKLRSFPFWSGALLPSLILFFAGVLVNIYLYHSISGVYSLSHEFQMTNWWEGFYGIFFSVGKSIFIYCPFLIVAVFFWRKFYREYTPSAVFILTTFILLFFITAPFKYWSDETWTVRKLIPIIPFLHFPLVFFVSDLKEKVKKIVLIGTVVVSFYIQFLGAAYNYAPQLDFLYQIKADSLLSMRYIPQFSHIYLYHRFFLSYLEKQFGFERTFYVYQEESWFRWFRGGEHDIYFHDASFSLEPYEQPHIIWFVRSSALKKVMFIVILSTLVISFSYLFSQYRLYCRKQGNGV